MKVLSKFAQLKTPPPKTAVYGGLGGNNSGMHDKPRQDTRRILPEILRFVASSLVSFLLDYGLFSLLTTLTTGLDNAGLVLANIVARIVSASANYGMNRNLVFKSKVSVGKSAGQYVILAAAILACNTLALHTLVEKFSLNPYWAKLLTELFFFILSWLAQRLIIFKKSSKSSA